MSLTAWSYFLLGFGAFRITGTAPRASASGGLSPATIHLLIESPLAYARGTVPVLSCKHFQNRIAAKVRQPLIAPSVVLRQLPMIYSHRVQDRRVEVVDRVRLYLRLVSVFISSPDHLPALHAAAGQP